MSNFRTYFYLPIRARYFWLRMAAKYTSTSTPGSIVTHIDGGRWGPNGTSSAGASTG